MPDQDPRSVDRQAPSTVDGIWEMRYALEQNAKKSRTYVLGHHAGD